MLKEPAFVALLGCYDVMSPAAGECWFKVRKDSKTSDITETSELFETIFSTYFLDDAMNINEA